MRFTRGQRVRLSNKENPEEVEGTIALVSENQQSLAVSFDHDTCFRVGSHGYAITPFLALTRQNADDYAPIYDLWGNEWTVKPVNT